MKIYLASPLGFSPENNHYLESIKQCLCLQGHTVFCPWEQSQTSGDIEAAHQISDYRTRVSAFKVIADRIGKINEDGIVQCDALLAVLDGAEVDSGTAGEVGFASAMGKLCFGLRTDIRNCGDFIEQPFNLQIMWFIERTGGRIFRKLGDLHIPA
jgi:nucleoside 2-deoxyribosyltransferase